MYTHVLLVIFTNMLNFVSKLLSIFFLIAPLSIEHKQNRILTPIESDDLSKILNESYYNLYGKKLDEHVLAGAHAHISLENKHGQRIWNHNIGNIGNLPQEPQEPYYSHFGKAKYRSYSSFIKGGEGYWKFMSRCPMAIKNFKLRNPRGAALSLGRCNYYRSEQEGYAQALSSLYEKALRKSKNFNSSG